MLQNGSPLRWSRQFPGLAEPPAFATEELLNWIDSHTSQREPPRTVSELVDLQQNLTALVLETHEETRELHGDIQTRYDLASFVTAQVLDKGAERPELSIIDPTSGTGVFMITVVEALEQSGYCTALTVCGIERNRDSALIAWFCMTMLVDLVDIELDFSVINDDLLAVAHQTDSKQYDILIGNPPWITWTDLPQADKNTWIELEAEDFDFVSAKGMHKALGATNTDISTAIIMLAVQQLGKPGAIFGFLLKRNIINTPSTRYFREGQIPHIEGKSLGLLAYIKILSTGNFFTGDDLKTDLMIGQAGITQTTEVQALTVRMEDTWETVQSYSLYRQEIPGDVIYHTNQKPLPLNEEETVEIRHGIKHDCTAVFDITQEIAESINWECVYPTVKSRHVKRDGWTGDFSLVIVPTTSLQETSEEEFCFTYPSAYGYLAGHRDRLNQRKSRWFQGREFYSIFGVGDYSFAPYKVAWVRLGWKPIFVLLEPVELPNGEQLPVVPSDHYLFIPVSDPDYGQYLVDLLNSEPYQYAMSVLSSKTKSSLPKRIISKLDLPDYKTYKSM